MSWWTYVKGFVEVRPFGRTQAEERYILETALNHLPIISRVLIIDIVNFKMLKKKLNKYGQMVAG